MRTATAAETRRHCDELIGRVERTDDVAGVFATAAPKLRQLVAHDAAAWIATDPSSGLPAGPTQLEGVDGVSAACCSEHWRREFIEEDVNRFVHLAKADRPVGALRAQMVDPGRSQRFRRFVRPLGFTDELRMVLRVGDATWGTLTLWRREGQPAFSGNDIEVLASLSSPIADALRRRSQPRGTMGGHPDGPGMLVFDRDGALQSLNDDARAWLADLPVERTFDNDLGAPIPLWLTTIVLSASAVIHGSGDGTARARVPTRRGAWLACHASCLRDADGVASHTVVTIEPAPPAAVASIAVDAYDLSERERQVAASIARGRPTSQIAGDLHISAHTVRDHVKSLFRKTGVTSRGELVAKLYAEHYQPRSSLTGTDGS